MRFFKSLKLKSFYILFLMIFCFTKQIVAWDENANETINPGIRAVCVRNSNLENQTLEVHSKQEGSPCPPNTQAFKLVIGKDPAGSLALVPLKRSKMLEMKLNSLKQNESQEESATKIWTFACLRLVERSILGVTLKEPIYRGDIGLNKSDFSCLDAQHEAEKSCREQFYGNELLESCLGGVNFTNDF